MLSHGEHCVCDIGGAVAMSPALVSHHLRVLRSAGLLRERRQGRWVFYSLDLHRLAELRAAVVGLLTPNDSAATECACSDCGPSGGPRQIPGNPLHSLPVLAGTAR